jgi:hypothetical protein
MRTLLMHHNPKVKFLQLKMSGLEKKPNLERLQKSRTLAIITMYNTNGG